jgi:cytochrome P450
MSFRPLQWAMSAMRRFAPIVMVGRSWPGLMLLFRHADVLEVLTREDDFSVALGGLKMKATIGSFFLGMGDKTPQYRRERAAMGRAVLPEDLGRTRRFAGSLASQIVEQAIKERGEVDLVADLANVVVPRFVNDYYGIAEPPDGSLLAWFKVGSYYVFGIDLLVGPRFYVPAARAGEQIARHITSQIEERRGALEKDDKVPDDILTRLLRAEAHDGTDTDTIRRMLTGSMSGTLIPTGWLAVVTIRTLLQLPKRTLEKARRAAQIGDDATVRQYVVEAARFHPFPPVIYRYCERDTAIAVGTPRERIIPEGTQVLCVMGSAALDPAVVPSPGSFIAGRPEEQYMLFGHGHHHCLGKDIAETLMTEMVKPLLLLDLERPIAPVTMGPKGRVVDGYYPAHLIVHPRR